MTRFPCHGCDRRWTVQAAVTVDRAAGVYIFHCAGCGRTDVRTVHRQAGLLEALVRQGARELVPHPERAQGGPAICHDDVLEFALSVAVVNDLAAYAAEVEA